MKALLVNTLHQRSRQGLGFTLCRHLQHRRRHQPAWNCDYDLTLELVL